MGFAERVIPYPVFGCLLFYVTTDPSQRTIGCLKKEYEPTGGAYDQSLGCAVYRFRETSDEQVKQSSPGRDPLVLLWGYIVIINIVIVLLYYFIIILLLFCIYYSNIFCCIFASKNLRWGYGLPNLRLGLAP